MRIVSLLLNLCTFGDEKLQNELINNFKKYAILKNIYFKTFTDKDEKDEEFDYIFNKKKRINYINGDQTHLIIFNFNEFFKNDDKEILVIFFFVKILFILLHQNDFLFYKNDENLIKILITIKYLKILINNKFISTKSQYLIILEENILDVIFILSKYNLTISMLDQSVVENKNKDIKKIVKDQMISNNFNFEKNFLMKEISKIKNDEKPLNDEEKKKLYIIGKSIIKMLRRLYISFKSENVTLFDIPNDFKTIYNKIEKNKVKIVKEKEIDAEFENILEENIEKNCKKFKSNNSKIIEEAKSEFNILEKEISNFENNLIKEEENIELSFENKGIEFSEIKIKNNVKKINSTQEKVLKKLLDLMDLKVHKRNFFTTEDEYANYLKKLNFSINEDEKKDKKINEINNYILKKLNLKNGESIKFDNIETKPFVTLIEEKNKTIEVKNLKIGAHSNNFLK
jgi:hypothetical protein